MEPKPNGWIGASICLTAIFLPSFFLVIGALPFWDELRRRPVAQAALRGVNAAVVGLLLAALYQPVWTVGITNAADFALAVAAFLLLFMWQTPPWVVVILRARARAVVSLLSVSAPATIVSCSDVKRRWAQPFSSCHRRKPRRGSTPS